jgi:hypothetical protein
MGQADAEKEMVAVENVLPPQQFLGIPGIAGAVVLAAVHQRQRLRPHDPLLFSGWVRGAIFKNGDLVPGTLQMLFI